MIEPEPRYSLAEIIMQGERAAGEGRHPDLAPVSIGEEPRGEVLRDIRAAIIRARTMPKSPPLSDE